MTKGPIKLFMIAILAITLLCGVIGCDEPSNPTDQPTVEETTPDSGDKKTESTSTSIITSLTANSDVVNLSIDEGMTLTTCYTIKGKSSLNAAQKGCTYESSDSSIVKIVNKTMKAVGVGEATITVTSKTDPTKSCSFKVVVKDVFFDRSISSVVGDDDFSHELPDDGGYIISAGLSQGDYFIKGVEAVEWYVSVDITVDSVASTELYPKFGIVTSTLANTAYENKLYFFLNAEITSAGITSWADFGACEVANGGNWAWNPSVNNATARHKNAIYTAPEAITYGQTWTIAVARSGFDFHMWVNGVYAGSLTTLTDLFGVNNGTEFVPAASGVGFFQFNSAVKYENYSVTTDAAEVAAKIASIETPRYVQTWDIDDNE